MVGRPVDKTDCGRRFFQKSLFSAGISENFRSGRAAWRPNLRFWSAASSPNVLRTSLLVTVRSFPNGSACRDEADHIPRIV